MSDPFDRPPEGMTRPRRGQAVRRPNPEARRMRDLEAENADLRRRMADIEATLKRLGVSNG
jgi:hypothetical protein